MPVREVERRLRESSLMRLAKMDKSVWTRTIREVTETAAATLDVSRASVWLFNEEGSAVTCEDLFHAPTGAHEHGVVLRADEYPRYLQALREKRSIAAGDALTHPDTAEFVEGYLKPLGIRAMLDVPIWHRGAVAGIFCMENVGATREWRPDDQDFVASVAEVVALALEARERVRAEEALRVSEARFRTMFEQFPLSMQILSPQGETLQVNRSFEKLFGLTLPEMKDFNLLHDPQLRENGMLPLLERGFREEATVIPPLLYQLPGYPNGPARWIQGFVYPMKSEAGAVREVIVVHQDVTEQKRDNESLRRTQEELESRVAQRTAELAGANAALQAEIVERKRSDEELRQTASELQAIFRALPDQYFRLDSEGTVLDYRSGQAIELPPSPCGIVGRRMQDLLPPEASGRFGESLREVVREGGTACVEYPLPANGKPAYFEARLVRLGADCGDEIITIIRDITDRVVAEEALQRSEEHFRTLTENASDIVTILDPQGVIQYQSQAAERAFGYRIEEMVDSSAFDFFHPDDIAPTLAALVEVVNEPGITRSAEFRFRHKEGGYVFCEAVGRTLLPHSAEGGVVVNTRDITARKEAEEALRESEARSSAIIQHALDCVITIDHEGRVLEFNPAAEATFGFTREEAIGRGLNDLIIPPEFHEAHHRGIEHYLRTGEGPVLNQRIEVPALRKDGSRITVELAATAIPLSEFPVFTAYIRDVTELRRGQEALRESEERLRFALEAGEMGTFEWDLATDRVHWSPALEAIHGRAPGGLGVGLDEIESAIHPEDREAVRSSGWIALQGLQRYDVEYRVIWPDGEVHWVAAQGQIVRNEEGGAVRLVGVCTDITARKEAEAALRQAKEDAEAANRAKSEFLSRMSHELRTPMNSILGFGQILARKPLPPDQRRSLDYILKAGNHLLQLINEVLDIARIEANRLQLSLEPVNVSGVLGEALSLIQPLASQRGCRVEAGTTRDQEQYVLADRQRLTQVLLNLLSNAVKYNRPHGSVSLSCGLTAEEGEERVQIRVRDTGPGIPLEQQDLLFVPFERLGADQSGIEGTGLGLALSKRLVEAMGGTLTVESVVGEGSTFLVTLAPAESPLMRLGRNGPLPAPEGTGEAAAVPETSASLLYIEDNLANLSLIETILTERAEIGLRSALQGRLGLDLAVEHRPDLILLDLHLPDLPGEEVLRRLKGDPRTEQIPVVVISADATPGTIERLLKAGAHSYLPKPLDVDEFLQTIDGILGPE